MQTQLTAVGAALCGEIKPMLTSRAGGQCRYRYFYLPSMEGTQGGVFSSSVCMSEHVEFNVALGDYGTDYGQPMRPRNCKNGGK